MTDDRHAAIIEARARAIYEAMGYNYESRTIAADGEYYGMWALAIRCATATLAADTAAGFWPAPREVTEVVETLAQMDARLDDGTHAFDAWAPERIVFNIGKERRITVADLRKARAMRDAALRDRHTQEGE